MTTAAVAAAYGLNQSAPSGYESEATVLVEARLTAAAPATVGPSAAPTTASILTPVTPDVGTERAVALSDAVVLPAAGRVGADKASFLEDLTIEVTQDANVLRFAYTADNRFSARIRARALVEAYVNYRATGPTGVTVLSEPSLPDTPVTRPLGPDLAAGLAAGLLLGAGTALLRSRTRGLIRGRDDYERLTGVPVLATVPRHKRPAGTTSGAPVVLRDPTSPAAESYRYLRTRLQPSLRPTTATTVLVTSPGDRQGRTTTAANLAVTLAQAGRSVILVDADLRHPQLHHVFGISGEYGLTTLLDGEAGVEEVLEETPVPGLHVIPAGRREEGEHVDLLDSGRLARVLHAVQKHADVVVLDSTAVLSASDAIALAALSDHILLVGDFARTSRESVRRALDELAEVVHDNVSPVLVNVPKSAGALVPHARTQPTGITPHHEPLTRDRLVSDADDVAPPGVTQHAYVEVAEEEDDEAEAIAEYFARTTTVAVPVIYGSANTATVYASSTAAESSAASDSSSAVSDSSSGADADSTESADSTDSISEPEEPAEARS
ncbi:polysaccharide biosynthesis tyrosine autokinase [Actinoplanes flavus]|uniref:AAA family ATPase n=1 Tax=Actinoplanes flavus TaxID=2820290 RepID=A0ABS3UJR4_9ACTN|nr:AAA family ATPase [Actinoplanes flavus]MBO3737942.1 AAA family ATPase [Actinoplanes flavus]